MFASAIKSCKAEAKKHAKKNKGVDVDEYAKELFLKRANGPYKTKLDDDGDDEVHFELKRRYQVNTYAPGDYKRKTPTGKKINRPVFWKKNREGEYEDITSTVPFTKKGTILVCQAQFRLYSVSGKYGITVALGPNIIILWRDYTKRAPSNDEGSSTTTPDLPFFE